MSYTAQIGRIPELAVFDETEFDCNPLWHIGAAPKPAVLIVDDDPTIAELLHRLLRSLVSDHAVIMETSPEALLPHLHGRIVPLVITDFAMPQMNGLDLTAQIKAHSPQTRVLLMSAFASRSLERQALTQQVDFYLPKPFQLVNLEQVITTALMSR